MKRRLGIAWSLISALCVVLVVSALITWGIIAALDSDDPVAIHEGRIVTERVPVGGSVQITFVADRRRSCPGTVVHTYSSMGEGPAQQIILSYPAIDVAAKVYRRNSAIKLPPGVGPGMWRYSMTLNSNCAGHHIVDSVLSGTIEVYEP